MEDKDPNWELGLTEASVVISMSSILIPARPTYLIAFKMFSHK
jgi:hypothetical protein